MHQMAAHVLLACKKLMGIFASATATKWGVIEVGHRSHLAIIDNTVEEGSSGEVLKGRGGRAVVQQVLGCQQHQGLLKRPVQLPPEGVKHLSRGSGIHDKHVGQTLSMPPHVLHHDPLPYILHLPPNELSCRRLQKLRQLAPCACIKAWQQTMPTRTYGLSSMQYGLLH